MKTGAWSCSISASNREDYRIPFQGDKYKVSLRLTAINITNNYELYNFLSTFYRLSAALTT